MRILNFNVCEQQLRKSGNFRGIAKGSKGYLGLKFNFADPWDSLVIVAVFRHGSKKQVIPVVDGYCAVPDEMAAQTFFVSLCGRMGTGQITTNEEAVYLE